MFKIIYDREQLYSHSHFLANPLWKELTINDIKALDDLMGLWEEGHVDETESSCVSEPLSNQASAVPLDIPPIISTPGDYKPKS